MVSARTCCTCCGRTSTQRNPGRRFSYPLLQRQRRLQGPIWSSEGEAVPADRTWEVTTLARSLKDESGMKAAGEECASGRRQMAASFI